MAQKQKKVEQQKILTLELRPRSFAEVLGQRTLLHAISNQVKKRMPQAWLFHGPSGTGKTTLARIIALSYQCAHEEFGAPCSACWEAWNTYAIHEINASEVNKVEDMALLAEQARYGPQPPSRYRVFILDEAQRVTTAAQNLLLKPFEEPAPSTIWIICTTEPNKILTTLKRRCMTYAVNPLSITNVEVFLKRYAKRIGYTLAEEELFDAVHNIGVNAPAMLLMILEKLAAGASVQQAVTGLSEDSLIAIAACRALVAGDWNTLRKSLRDASTEDARLLRASVLGYLKAMLLKEASAAQRKTISACMRDLSNGAPFEDALLLPWLMPVLHDACARFAK